MAHAPDHPLRLPGQSTGAGLAFFATVAMLLAGCAGGPRAPANNSERDGVGSATPANLAQIGNAQPRVEAIRSGGANKPYTVLGRNYTPITTDRPFSERGLASWYGRKFHGRPTASGEAYDMYAMTAAHPTMPLPSYARVRNPANGREVVVRINDRGPFHDGRVIDLSYTAAGKLDLLRGVAAVEVERITYEDIRAGTWQRSSDTGPFLASARPAPAAVVAPAARDVSAVPVATAALVTPVARVATGAPRAAIGVVATTSLGTASSDDPQPLASDSTVTELHATSLDAVDLVMFEPVPQALLRRPDATAAVAPAPAGAVEGPTFWVQLGAFGQPDAAERLRQQVGRRIDAVAPSLDVVSERDKHRLQAGPFASREQARDAADAIRRQLDLDTLIVERR